MSRRVLADADGTQTVYVYDGAQVIAEYSLVSQTLTLKKRFIYGPGIDEPVCMITYSGGSESGRYFYHFDGQGNVIALSNSSGNVVEEYEYDVYGLVSVQSLGQTWDRSQYGNPYLFTGRRWDGDTGLYYYRARMYSPDLGRFLQPDPLGYFDGMNLYAYCGNNPVNWIVPLGLCKSNKLFIPDPEKVENDCFDPSNREHWILNPARMNEDGTYNVSRRDLIQEIAWARKYHKETSVYYTDNRFKNKDLDYIFRFSGRTFAGEHVNYAGFIAVVRMRYGYFVAANIPWGLDFFYGLSAYRKGGFEITFGDLREMYFGYLGRKRYSDKIFYITFDEYLRKYHYDAYMAGYSFVDILMMNK